MIAIYDKDSKTISKSKNLRGLRRKVSESSVDLVGIYRLEDGKGKLLICFSNSDWCETEFADFSVLKETIRNWQNLYGARLFVDGFQRGHIHSKNHYLR